MDHCNEIDMEDSKYGLSFNRLGQFGYRRDGDDDDDDEEELKNNPEYNYFFENIKQDENEESFSVAIPISSDLSLVLRYEGKEQKSFENVDRTRGFQSNLEREKAKVSEILDGFSGKTRADSPETLKRSLEIRDKWGKKNLRDVPDQERKRGDDEIELQEVAEVDPVPCKSSGEPLKMMNCVARDESQPKFLYSLDKFCKNTELSSEKDQTSAHHKNGGRGADVQAFTLDDMPLHEGDYTPFVPSKCYQPSAADESRDAIRTSSLSQFREKLMALLRTHFDQNEFDSLWRKVTERKSVHGYRDLRHRRMKDYSTKTRGKSYLDRHQELRMKIDEFRSDERKVLHLLRGFFFWLEEKARAGERKERGVRTRRSIFMHWNYYSLKIMILT